MLASYVALYRALGLATIRVQPQGKAPIGYQWQTRTDEPQDFQPGENVGVRLGDPSGGLVDIDLDCPEAVLLAYRFLPSTCAFGRASKPISHWLYRCPGQRTRKPSRVPVELRSTGGQTVFPPSTHESGEAIEWWDESVDEYIKPREITSAELESAFGKLCAATLIARVAPKFQGQTHDAILALTGALWHEGWTADDVAALILPALELGAPDSDHDHHKQTIEQTFDPDNERNRYGWSKVAEIIGEPDCKALQRSVELVPSNPRGGGADGPLTDAGNAERFAADHGEDLRYCPGLGWLQWDGSRWAIRTDDPYELAIRSARKLGGKFGLASEDFKRLRATVAIAKTLPQLRTELEQLDADPWLLNCPNGQVDLRTGALTEPTKGTMPTRITGVPYDPTMPTPRFDAFMVEIFDGDRELSQYVLRYIGQALSGLPSERCLQVWWGTGSNGKSTLVDLLLDVLGDYARMLSIGLLLDTGRPRSSANASPDLAALRGVRFAAGVETSEHQRWNESLVKQLTGTDKLTARFLYQREVMTFPPTWTLALATNHKPIVRGVDPAIWDRIHLVPFEVRFEGDRTLHDTLRKEAPGILAKLVTACIAWRVKGLCPPARVLAEVEEYKADQDTIGQFINECCTTGPGLTTLRSALWAAYKDWAEESREEFVLGRKTFNQRIAGRFESDGKGKHAKWLGVACGAPAAIVRTTVERAKQ